MLSEARGASPQFGSEPQNLAHVTTGVCPTLTSPDFILLNLIHFLCLLRKAQKISLGRKRLEFVQRIKCFKGCTRFHSVSTMSAAPGGRQGDTVDHICEDTGAEKSRCLLEVA